VEAKCEMSVYIRKKYPQKMSRVEATVVGIPGLLENVDIIFSKCLFVSVQNELGKSVSTVKARPIAALP
jgi:hypothetical protein